jgi:hypothetical protein
MTQPAAFSSGDFEPSGGLDDALENVFDDVPLDAQESLDSDDLGDTDAGEDPLDDSWDPPDRASADTRRRLTSAERRTGPTLERQLAQEDPDIDPYLEAEVRESGAVLDADVSGVGSPPSYLDGTDTRIAGLVADDEGGYSPGESELLAREVRASRDRPADAASPEEDALHLDPGR